MCSAEQHGADRLVAAAQPLGDGHEVGRDAFLLAGVQRAGAAHAAHHLVEDQQHAVAVANLADALEVAFGRRHGAGGGADHRLGDEGHHRVGAELVDLGFERARGALGIGLLRLARLLEAIGEAGIDVMRLDQQRREGRAPPFVAAGRQRAQRIAVIALATGDDVAALFLAALGEILPRHLERRFDRFRPAAHEIGVADAFGGVGDQPVGESLGHFGGEEAGMGIGELVELLVQGRRHCGMAVPQAGHRGAARGVDVALAGGIDDFDALAAGGDRQGSADLAMKNVRHVFLARHAAAGARRTPRAAPRCARGLPAPCCRRGPRPGRRGSRRRPAMASWCEGRMGCRSPPGWRRRRSARAARPPSRSAPRPARPGSPHSARRRWWRGHRARRWRPKARRRDRRRGWRRGRCRPHRPASPSCRSRATACSGSARPRRGRSAGPGNRRAAPRAGGRPHRPGVRAMRVRQGLRSGATDAAPSRPPAPARRAASAPRPGRPPCRRSPGCRPARRRHRARAPGRSLRDPGAWPAASWWQPARRRAAPVRAWRAAPRRRDGRACSARPSAAAAAGCRTPRRSRR